MRALSVAAVAVILVALPAPAGAWESASTHAGLSEQAALTSSLHKHLKESLGVKLGLLARLVVPPKDASALIAVLKRESATNGYVPDSKGRQTALGWLVAGSAIADASFAQNHYLEPKTGKGLDDRTLSGTRARMRIGLSAKRVSESLTTSGVAANKWLRDPTNPMGHAGFIDQYAKSVRSKTPGERERHLAGALVAAGGMLHILQDMGSPSHVRIDLAAHLSPAGAHPSDLGSRLERLAALAYGRLGVPASGAVVSRNSLEDFFVGADDKGLAAITAAAWYSLFTLPAEQSLSKLPSKSEVETAIAAAVNRQDLGVAPSDSRGLSGTLRSASGHCLALYRAEPRSLVFDTDDSCVLEQLAVILPKVGAFSSAFIDYLFRGKVVLSVQASTVAVRLSHKGSGQVELYWEDARGVRSRLASQKTDKKNLSLSVRVPRAAKALVALFAGTSSGEPLVAAGYLPLN